MIRKADREEFMRRLAAEHPNPKSELNFSSPFELLVAVVLSAQATDKGVNLATAKLFPVANTPEAILALGEEGLTPYVKTIGLYRNKVKHILGLCERLLSVYGGQVPEDREALMTLPGVGRKTANVVLNVAFGHPTLAVDTHIFRVANRTGLAKGKNARRDRRKAPQGDSPRFSSGRPPLAPSARTLLLQGAPPRVRTLPRRRILLGSRKEEDPRGEVNKTQRFAHQYSGFF